MAGAMYVINVWDGACPRHYTLNNWFKTLSGGVFLRLSDRIWYSLKYFGLYKLSLCMGTDPVQTDLVIHRCLEIYWTKTALQDGFVLYDFKNGKVFDLEEKVVPAGRHACSARVTSTSVNLPAIPVLYQTRVSLVNLKSLHRDYGEYRVVSSGPNEPSGEAGVYGVCLEELFQQELL